MERRLFLKASLAGSALTTAWCAGLLTPQAVLAAWPKSAMESDSFDTAIGSVGGKGSADSAIKMKAPEIAENGAVVPITIDATKLDGVESISLFVEKNYRPLAATYNLKAGAKAFVSTRIKMGKTDKVIAAVKTASGVKTAEATVKVTVGGCG